MAPRKKPILIRRSGLTGTIYALTNYREHQNGLIEAMGGGKHDVTADVEAIVSERCRPLVEFVEHVAKWSRDPSLRHQASAILPAFRAQSEATPQAPPPPGPPPPGLGISETGKRR